VALRDEGAYRGGCCLGVVHTVTGTAANEADINQMAAVLHGQESAVFADAGYTGTDQRRNTRTARSPGTSRSSASSSRRCPNGCGIWQRRWRGHSHRCAPGSSTRSTSSRTCSTIRSCATAAWPRTPRSCTPCLRLPSGDRQENPARPGAGLMTPADCLGPANGTEKPNHNPDFCRLRSLPSAALSEIRPGLLNRHLRRHCSVFP
jgi:hypothetical protein